MYLKYLENARYMLNIEIQSKKPTAFYTPTQI